MNIYKKWYCVTLSFYFFIPLIIYGIAHYMVTTYGEQVPIRVEVPFLVLFLLIPFRNFLFSMIVGKTNPHFCQDTLDGMDLMFSRIGFLTKIIVRGWSLIWFIIVAFWLSRAYEKYSLDGVLKLSAFDTLLNFLNLFIFENLIFSVVCFIVIPLTIKSMILDMFGVLISKDSFKSHLVKLLTYHRTKKIFGW
jgi:hypothetical protein